MLKLPKHSFCLKCCQLISPNIYKYWFEGNSVPPVTACSILARRQMIKSMLDTQLKCIILIPCYVWGGGIWRQSCKVALSRYAFNRLAKSKFLTAGWVASSTARSCAEGLRASNKEGFAVC